jgi:hypothetical protein
MRRLLFLLMPVYLGGCATSRTSLPTIAPSIPEEPTVAFDSAARVVDPVLAVRSTQRVAELKNLGGECAAYGSVLESSILDGRVSVRPFMWRVGGRLVSGEARSTGDIIVARHIDPMNVGTRTVDDMVRTLEHEAAHVAFRVTNGPSGIVDHANAIVEACRGEIDRPADFPSAPVRARRR